MTEISTHLSIPVTLNSSLFIKRKKKLVGIKNLVTLRNFFGGGGVLFFDIAIY